MRRCDFIIWYSTEAVNVAASGGEAIATSIVLVRTIHEAIVITTTAPTDPSPAPLNGDLEAEEHANAESDDGDPDPRVLKLLSLSLGRLCFR